SNLVAVPLFPVYKFLNHQAYKAVNNGTATKLDAYRGLIAFINGDFLYIVSSQRTFLDGRTTSFMKQEAVALKQMILDFVETIEFS
ncbi:MAG: hypothetical protein AAFS12_08880, partial [Cyanobacteria bacterium J06632_19]